MPRLLPLTQLSPSRFGTSNQFRGRRFFLGLGVGTCVAWGWFNKGDIYDPVSDEETKGEVLHRSHSERVSGRGRISTWISP